MTPPYVAALTFLLSFVLTPAARGLGRRYGLLDLPNERSSHQRPTPRTGGLAICAALILILPLTVRRGLLPALLVPGALIAILGFADDVRRLPVWMRFGLQVLCAIAAVAWGGTALNVLEVPHLGLISFVPLVAVLLSLFWIVGTTNAYNFMDGINGIAAIEAMVAGSTLAYLLGRAGDDAGSLLAAALAGAAAGFLPWNVPSGSIFMGDSASGTFGFLFALLTLRANHYDVPFIAAALPLGPFLFDTTITLLRRIWRRERFYSAHRTHLYQMLVRLGWSHTAVTMLWGFMALVSGIVSAQYENWNDSGKVMSLALVLLLYSAVAGMIYVKRRSRRMEGATI